MPKLTPRLNGGFKIGMRVKLSKFGLEALGRRKLFGPDIRGEVTGFHTFHDDVIWVRMDGRKHPRSWNVKYWTPE